ncbi:penicillin-binding protein 2 [Patescibacteria group bacterium]|nr:MAG: penicillin-binding protein 2 [Patescibacteria group bacterium]
MGDERRSRWKPRTATGDRRTGVFRGLMALFAVALVGKLFLLQVMDHPLYAALASGQHGIFQRLFPSRGDILIHDLKDDALIPAATNQRLAIVFADPRGVEDPEKTAALVGEAFGYDEEKVASLARRLSRRDDPYEPIERRVPEATLARVLALALPGIRVASEETRFYPEKELGGHVFGFLGPDDDGAMTGKYGIEGWFDEELAGTPGYLKSERDISGRIIAVGEQSVMPAVPGSDVVLTIDRTIQYRACQAIVNAVARYQADGGSVVIIEPGTGRILALCATPDFDPGDYGRAGSVSVFNNPAIFDAYEPGSVFKAFTMAAAVDAGAVTPESGYEDTGKVTIGAHDIENSDRAAHGWQTMTQALEKSLNTGMIFAMRETGRDVFAEYVKRFGFGERTGIELETEAPGDIRSLDKESEVFPATASYGQGITVTVLQLAAAYAAIADGGILKAPRIVDEVRRADGTVETRASADVRRVIDQKTARLIAGMLVSVVEKGHGRLAGVKGYYVAGKTGTAQVARQDGRSGYEDDATIGSFAGFAPVEDPKFAMVVRIDRPQGARWAESTAAPVFGELAKFLLEYFEVPPTRK